MRTAATLVSEFYNFLKEVIEVLEESQERLNFAFKKMDFLKNNFPLIKELQNHLQEGQQILTEIVGEEEQEKEEEEKSIFFPELISAKDRLMDMRTLELKELVSVGEKAMPQLSSMLTELAEADLAIKKALEAAKELEKATGVAKENEEKDEIHQFFSRLRIQRVENVLEGLSMRSRRCLEDLKIEYLWQLVQKSEKDLLKVRNFGKKSLSEIKEKLAKLGLGLGMIVNDNTYLYLNK